MAAAAANLRQEQAVFDRLFQTELAQHLQQPTGGSKTRIPSQQREQQEERWIVSFEQPPQAYLHVSKPHWGDERMNGIHLETYVLGQQLRSRIAPVALHCEGGCPFRADFIKSFVRKLDRAGITAEQRKRGNMVSIPSMEEVGRGNCCSALEISVPLEGMEPGAAVLKLAREVQWMQTFFGDLIDETIAECVERMQTF